MNSEVNCKKMLKLLIVAFLCSELDNGFVFSAKDKVTAEAIVDADRTCAFFKNAAMAKHQASIRLSSQEEIFGRGHICAGALIASSVVVTAAHCVIDANANKMRHPSEFTVVLGNLELYRRADAAIIYGVTHVLLGKADVAILMLSANVPEQQTHITPIDYNSHGTKQLKTANLQITSWLRPKESAMFAAFCTHLKTTSSQKCQHTSHICFDAQSATTLDSGAPILYQNQLIGLIDKCRTNIDNISCTFIDMHVQQTWIRQTTGDGSHQNSSIWGVIAFVLFTVFVMKNSTQDSCM